MEFAPDQVNNDRHDQQVKQISDKYSLHFHIDSNNNELENVIEEMEEDDEDIIDLRRTPITPQPPRVFFEEPQVRA